MFDSWIEEMLKDVNPEDKPDDDKSKNITLTDEQLDRVADRVIEQLSDVSASKPDKKKKKDKNKDTDDNDIEPNNNDNPEEDEE